MTTSNIEGANEGGAAVSCTNLWKIYGPNPAKHLTRVRAGTAEAGQDGYTAAVQDVSFDVKRGETFVVMGLSGSGKSTLIRCLTRLIEPTDGEVSVDGRLVTSMSASELREFRRHECGMVFQHFGLLPHRRVIDNVAYGLEVTGVRRAAREKRAQDVLELVGLGGWERRHPEELSGGMKQRVGLARALAVDPRLLLLDEPFSALDPLIRRELQDELLRLSKVVNQTAVFITHDMSEALKVGDRIAIMRGGSLVQVGTPEEIVLNPADDYVRRFSEDASRLRIVQASTIASEPLVLRDSISVAEVSAALDQHSLDYAFLVDEHGVPSGIVTGRDARTAGPSASAGSVAGQSGAVSVKQSDVIDDAVRLLAGGAPAVAVVDSSGKLTGVIDGSAIIRTLANRPQTVAVHDVATAS